MTDHNIMHLPNPRYTTRPYQNSGIWEDGRPSSTYSTTYDTEQANSHRTEIVLDGLTVTSRRQHYEAASARPSNPVEPSQPPSSNSSSSPPVTPTSSSYTTSDFIGRQRYNFDSWFVSSDRRRNGPLISAREDTGRISARAMRWDAAESPYTSSLLNPERTMVEMRRDVGLSSSQIIPLTPTELERLGRRTVIPTRQRLPNQYQHGWQVGGRRVSAREGASVPVNTLYTPGRGYTYQLCWGARAIRVNPLGCIGDGTPGPPSDDDSDDDEGGEEVWEVVSGDEEDVD